MLSAKYDAAMPTEI